MGRRAPLVLLGLLVAGPARADPEREAQEALDRGIEYYQAGNLVAAREAFAHAKDLVPERSNPYRYLGLVEARLGLCADAVVHLDAFFQRLKHVPEGDDRIAEATAARDRCKRELLPHLGTLVVESSPAGAEVRLDREDGPPAGPTPHHEERLRPGAHFVSLKSDGFEPLKHEFTVAADETVRLFLVLQPIPPPAAASARAPDLKWQPPGGVGASPGLDLAAPGPVKETPRRRYWIIGVVAGAVAVAAVGVGLGVGLSRRAATELPDVSAP